MKSRRDIEAQYKRIIWNPNVTKERFERVSDARQRYLNNIYKTKASKSDRRAVRNALIEGGWKLAEAMDRIVDRKYKRSTYMGLNGG